MPAELREALGEYGGQISDGFSGETIGWGYKILRRLGEERWAEAGTFGDLECMQPSGQWYLITKWLTPREAIEKYGAVNDLVVGPSGGFKSVRYGEKQFGSRRLDPRK
jgi:hypothetical protein